MSKLKWCGFLVIGLAAALGAAEAAPKQKALTEEQVLKLIEIQIEDDAIIARLERGGLGFKVDEALIKRLKGAGASEDVVIALRRLNGEKEEVKKLEDDPDRKSIMVFVKPYYDATCPLPAVMFVNGTKIKTFNSEAQESIGEYLKMGWNTIVVKTTRVDPAKAWNCLYFKIGPTHKKGDEMVMGPVMWTFHNVTDWKHEGKAMKHRSGPDVKEVTLTFHLYYAGLKQDTAKVKKGDFVLTQGQYYGSTPPMTTTLIVNGTYLTTWLGADVRPQAVLTPLLRKGRNEVRIVTKAVRNVHEWNTHNFEIAGEAEWSTASDKYIFKPVLKIKGDDGWEQDKKTARFYIDEKPKADTLEKVMTFELKEAPKAK